MGDRTLTDSEVQKLLGSKDYKKRFIGEYYELKNRVLKLDAMLDKYDDGTLGFTFDCPYALLSSQSNAMWTYLSILETRAQMEQIDL